MLPVVEVVVICAKHSKSSGVRLAALDVFTKFQSMVSQKKRRDCRSQMLEEQKSGIRVAAKCVANLLFTS